MHTVKIRVRTPEGSFNGEYAIEDPSTLERLENPHKGLHALEEALYASGLMVNPFDVTEASVFTEKLTFLYHK